MPEAPSAPKSKQVTIPSKLHDRLQAEADRRDVSATFLATRAIERAMPTWESTDLSRTFDAPEAE